jgi:hypothetical protein
MYYCICIFLGLSLRNTSKTLVIFGDERGRGVTCLYGTGFKDLVLLKSTKEKEFPHLS